MIRSILCILIALLLTSQADTWLADGQPAGASSSSTPVSITNLTGGFNLRVYSPTNILVDAMAQSIVRISLGSDPAVVLAPTNAFDGRRLEWRVSAFDMNQTITFPAEIFRIPSSSTMSNTVVVEAWTTSIFLTERDEENDRWLITSYIWGY
ncbi:MAG TPA: hypothetical protein PKE12_11190 [Kiritimatiellia bacterium]|nr:hypothetical protein [Kiritimatiellia bacterium]